MSGDDIEIAEYVESLVEHGYACESRDCPLCHTLQDIFDVVRKRVFTSSLYPEVAISVASDGLCSSDIGDVAGGDT